MVFGEEEEEEENRDNLPLFQPFSIFLCFCAQTLNPSSSLKKKHESLFLFIYLSTENFFIIFSFLRVFFL
jgi:hypothetical protein